MEKSKRKTIGISFEAHRAAQRRRIETGEKLGEYVERLIREDTSPPRRRKRSA